MSQESVEIVRLMNAAFQLWRPLRSFRLLPPCGYLALAARRARYCKPTLRNEIRCAPKRPVSRGSGVGFVKRNCGVPVVLGDAPCGPVIAGSFANRFAVSTSSVRPACQSPPTDSSPMDEQTANDLARRSMRGFAYVEASRFVRPWRGPGQVEVPGPSHPGRVSLGCGAWHLAHSAHVPAFRSFRPGSVPCA